MNQTLILTNCDFRVSHEGTGLAMSDTKPFANAYNMVSSITRVAKGQKEWYKGLNQNQIYKTLSKFIKRFRD